MGGTWPHDPPKLVAWFSMPYSQECMCPFIAKFRDAVMGPCHSIPGGLRNSARGQGLGACMFWKGSLSPTLGLDAQCQGDSWGVV